MGKSPQYSRRRRKAKQTPPSLPSAMMTQGFTAKTASKGDDVRDPATC